MFRPGDVGSCVILSEQFSLDRLSIGGLGDDRRRKPRSWSGLKPQTRTRSLRFPVKAEQVMFGPVFIHRFAGARRSVAGFLMAGLDHLAESSRISFKSSASGMSMNSGYASIPSSAASCPNASTVMEIRAPIVRLIDHQRKSDARNTKPPIAAIPSS